MGNTCRWARLARFLWKNVRYKPIEIYRNYIALLALFSVRYYYMIVRLEDEDEKTIRTT